MDDEATHIDAIARARDAGFQFLHLRDGIGVTAIHAERHSLTGVVDTITMRARAEAIAARYRTEDYQRAGNPLWQRTGTVVEVIIELLDLRAHGQPGAPSVTHRASSALWLPGAL